MPDYERIVWETAYFNKNLQNLDGLLRHLIEAQFANQVYPLGQYPGPLHVCLSRTYWQFNTCPVIAKFLALAHRSFPDTGVEKLVELLSPLMRWDYGMEPLAYGLDKIEDRDSTLAADLRRLSRDNVCDVVETIWRISLLGLSYSCTERDGAMEHFLSLAESRRAARCVP